jgi:hypothetical protein
LSVITPIPKPSPIADGGHNITALRSSPIPKKTAGYTNMSIYTFTAKDSHGNELSLSKYKGKLMLVVNTASKCGFTPQYKGLQELYDTWHEKGLEILAFPCNQFGQQEPGTNEDIQQFCSLNYGVTFPVLAKIDVNGENAHPSKNCWPINSLPHKGPGGFLHRNPGK